MIRATTGGVLRSYRTNLMNSFIRDNKARETVLSQRIFNSYAEDPASAAKAFRLRKSRMMASSQLKICDDTYHKYQGAYQCLQTVDELLDTENGGGNISTLKETALKMLNDPTGDARTQLNKVLDNLSDTIIQNMNQTYGDEFIFAGADGHNVPFEVKEIGGHKVLHYRGVPVDSTVPDVLTDANTGNKVTIGANNDYVKAGTATLSQDEYDAAIADGELTTDFTSYTAEDENGTKVTRYIRNADADTMTQDEFKEAETNAAKLEYLANEKRFVDIGLGMKEDENGKLIESSAFNESLSGLTFLGYGLDEEGDPKNIYSIVQQLKEIAANAPQEGKWDTETYDEFDRLVGKLENASSEFKTQFTNQSAGTEKLESSYELLKENVYNLKEQYSNLEDVNMADAISSFLWAEYCYNAALKVGNSILSQSLMDYLQ